MSPRHLVRRGLARHWGTKWIESPLAQRMLAYRMDGRDVIDRAHGCRVRFDPSTFLGQCLFLEGAFEDKEIDFLSARLSRKPDPVILDVGANIGWHALRWATAVPSARVHAFEPSPKARRYLDMNLHLNGVADRVKVVAKALADAEGSRRFFDCEDYAFSSLLDTRRNPVAEEREVHVTTLDNYCEAHASLNVALVKIDVEGLEYEVIRGGERLLRSRKPDLFVEIDQRNREKPTAEEVIDRVRAMGYEAFVFQYGEPVPAREYRFWFYNYWFTPSGTA
jgi:FkbM family methyltransferase